MKFSLSVIPMLFYTLGAADCLIDEDHWKGVLPLRYPGFKHV
jgi:hypothetical protein